MTALTTLSNTTGHTGIGNAGIGDSSGISACGIPELPVMLKLSLKRSSPRPRQSRRDCPGTDNSLRLQDSVREVPVSPPDARVYSAEKRQLFICSSHSGAQALDYTNSMNTLEITTGQLLYSLLRTG